MTVKTLTLIVVCLGLCLGYALNASYQGIHNWLTPCLAQIMHILCVSMWVTGYSQLPSLSSWQPQVEPHFTVSSPAAYLQTLINSELMIILSWWICWTLPCRCRDSTPNQLNALGGLWNPLMFHNQCLKRSLGPLNLIFCRLRCHQDTPQWFADLPHLFWSCVESMMQVSNFSSG